SPFPTRRSSDLTGPLFDASRTLFIYAPSDHRIPAMALDEHTEELARAAAGGDHRALGELLRRIEPDVLRHCARILPYHHDAEEAAQDRSEERRVGTAR